MEKLTRANWWWKYLEVIFSPREVFTELVNAKVDMYNVLAPFFVLIVTSFTLTLVILSNPSVVERFIMIVV